MNDDLFGKMADCPEIQGKWEPKDGDRFVLGVKKDRTPAICILGCHWRDCEGCTYEVENLKDECIWLPSETDLWGMVKKPRYSSWHLMLDAFRLWYYQHGMTIMFETRKEQLVAWVMWELYGKKWDNKEGWVK